MSLSRQSHRTLPHLGVPQIEICDHAMDDLGTTTSPHTTQRPTNHTSHSSPTKGAPEIEHPRQV
jgi:hypothetical protein